MADESRIPSSGRTSSGGSGSGHRLLALGVSSCSGVHRRGGGQDLVDHGFTAPSGRFAPPRLLAESEMTRRVPATATRIGGNRGHRCTVNGHAETVGKGHRSGT